MSLSRVLASHNHPGTRSGREGRFLPTLECLEERLALTLYAPPFVSNGVLYFNTFAAHDEITVTDNGSATAGNLTVTIRNKTTGPPPT